MGLFIGNYQRIKSITSNYIATGKEDKILADATSGNITITLPTASTMIGKIIDIIKTDNSSNLVLVNGSLEGLALYAVPEQIEVVASTSWVISRRLGDPAGKIIEFGGATAPKGYIACTGLALSRTNHANLFSKIGVLWGTGDGSTTFNTPDLKGMILRGAGIHSTQAMALGGNFDGSNVGTFQADKVQGTAHSHTTGLGLGWFAPSGPTYVAYSVGAYSGSSSTTSGSENFTNANGTPRIGNETKPATYSVLYCIRY